MKYDYNNIILILGDYVLLIGFKLGNEVFDVYGVDAKYLEYRSDEEFILYDRYECQVELVIRHVEYLF